MTSVISSAPPSIIVLSGSSRSGSYNTALARIARNLVEDAGGKAELVDLAAHLLPVYDFDLQARDGLPAAAMALKALFTAADGFLIASPEHNMAPSVLLKNAIDWVSRATATESGKVPFQDRPAALCAASVGPLGGQRGLIGLRMILMGLDVHVLPGVVGVGNAANAFDAEGGLAAESHRAAMRALVGKLVQTAKALRRVRIGQA
jgi:chromate reductase